MKMRTAIAIAILSLPLAVAARDAAAGVADSLVVPRTDTAPVLDGRLDDPEWQHAVAIPLRPAAGDVRLQPDVVWLLWDAKFLYVGYRTADEDIAATRTTESTDTCPNTFEGAAQDLMELFLAPEAGGYGWELHHNALGAFTDLRVKPGSGTAPPTLDRQAELPSGEDGLATAADLAPKANGQGTSTVNFPSTATAAGAANCAFPGPPCCRPVSQPPPGSDSAFWPPASSTAAATAMCCRRCPAPGSPTGRPNGWSCGWETSARRTSARKGGSLDRAPPQRKTASICGFFRAQIKLFSGNRRNPCPVSPSSGVLLVKTGCKTSWIANNSQPSSTKPGRWPISTPSRSLRPSRRI